MGAEFRCTGGVEIRLRDGIDCRATSRLAPACRQGFTLYASAGSNIWRMYVKIIMTIAAAAAAVVATPFAASSLAKARLVADGRYGRIYQDVGGPSDLVTPPERLHRKPFG